MVLVLEPPSETATNWAWPERTQAKGGGDAKSESGLFLSEEGATQRSDWGRARAGRVQRRQGGRLS